MKCSVGTYLPTNIKTNNIYLEVTPQNHESKAKYKAAINMITSNTKSCKDLQRQF